MAINVKRIEMVEDALAKLVSDLNLDEDEHTAFLFAAAAGTIAATHLEFVGLRPDEKGLGILTRAFQASFRHILKRHAMEKAWETEPNEARH